MTLERLEHAFLGPRHGPRLVFLHEGLGSLGLWRDFPQRVCDATGLGGFVYSRANYGKSAATATLPRPVTYMHDEAVELGHVLREAGIDDPVLVGHSDGASIALLHAGAGAPVRALILEAPHVFTEPFGLESIRKARDAYEQGGLRARLSRHHENVDAAFLGWNGAWLNPDFERHWNLEGSLPAIRAPVLLLQGRDDEYGSEAQLRAIERGVTGPVETVLLDRCGHAPHKDQPEATLAAILSFLQRAAVGNPPQKPTPT